MAFTVAAPSLARAETDEQRAVTLFERGRKLAREGRCAEAIAPFLESIRHAEGVGPLLNLGNCYETLGKAASAHRYFLRAEEVAAKNQDRRRDEAAQRAKAVEKDISTLLVHVPVSIKAKAEVKVDGEPWRRERWDVPWPIDPGVHEIEVVAPPSPRETGSITVRGKGDHAEWAAGSAAAAAVPIGPPAPLVFPLQSSPEPAKEGSSSQKTVGLAVGGVGVGGLALGAVFGVVSLSAHSSLVGRCPSYPSCPASDRVALDDMNDNASRSGTVSTIGIVAGGLLLLGGAILYFTAPNR